MITQYMVVARFKGNRLKRFSSRVTQSYEEALKIRDYIEYMINGDRTQASEFVNTEIWHREVSEWTI